MVKPIHDEKLNKVLLKPRFKIPLEGEEEFWIEQFKIHLKSDYPDYRSKIVGNHIVVDVPESEETFWSPQVHAEIEKDDGQTYLKGIMGPKPKVWTFFMFLHFAVAVAFFVFFVVFYTNWSLNQDYKFAMIMCIVMPIVWVLLYFSGQYGKKRGYNQMRKLYQILHQIVNQ